MFAVNPDSDRVSCPPPCLLSRAGRVTPRLVAPPRIHEHDLASSGWLDVRWIQRRQHRSPAPHLALAVGYEGVPEHSFLTIAPPLVCHVRGKAFRPDIHLDRSAFLLPLRRGQPECNFSGCDVMSGQVGETTHDSVKTMLLRAIGVSTVGNNLSRFSIRISSQNPHAVSLRQSLACSP